MLGARLAISSSEVSTEAPNFDPFGDRMHAFDPAGCTLGCHLLGVMGHVTC
jgi:hypothetical protein